MNALTTIDAISFSEIEPGKWAVTVDGKDTCQITKDGSGFIAWLGHQDRHWCFQRALAACAEYMRWHRSQHEKAMHAYDVAKAGVARMTEEERDEALDRLENERSRLKYAPLHMDVIAREAEIDRRVALLKGGA